MFKTEITRTSFTEGFVNEIFSHIHVMNTYSDVSLSSTARALLYPRLGENEGVFISYNAENKNERIFNGGYTDESIINSLYYMDSSVASNTISINELRTTASGEATFFEYISKKFTEVKKDFTKIEKITDFFKKVMNVLCFVNPEEKRVVLFTFNCDIRKYHYLQIAIPVILPWLFEEKPLDDDELELIRSLREKTSTAYESAIEKLATRYNFRDESIKRLLSGFETIAEKERIRRCEEDIAALNHNIEVLNDKIQQALEDIYEKEITILGLTAKVNEKSESSEIMEYFLSNKNLVLHNARGNKLRFVVYSDVEYFDEEIVERVLGNENSYIYGVRNQSKEDIKLLMTAIFLERKIKLRLCAAYELDIVEGVMGMSNYNFGAAFCNCLPNPHINRYSCLGNYNQTLTELIRENNYVMAIEQCIASCKSLNWADSAVMSEFIATLTTHGGKIFVLPDGREATLSEAINYIKEENETDGENN